MAPRTAARRESHPRERALFACLASGLLLMAMATSAFATEASYQCEDGTRLRAVFSPPTVPGGEVTLSIAGTEGSIVLPQTPSADGGRYEKDGTIFWIRGNGASLTRGGRATTCTTT